MSRIKKRGLDYFPMNTDFIHDRLVRRIMKREGDATIAVLLEALSYVYAGEGYYVVADQLFYEDISAGLYEKDTEGVVRIIRLAVEYGLFDADLFARHSILTSAEIQRQYLFSTKRRSVSPLEPAYCLLSQAELAGLQQKKPAKSEKKPEAETAATLPAEGNNVTFIPQNVTSGTHSIAQHSKAENSIAEEKKEYPPQDSPACAGEGGRKEGVEEKISFNKEAPIPSFHCQEEIVKAIKALQPPADGMARNYAGLLYSLHTYEVPLEEQYAIILKSNFGALGGPVWKGFSTLRNSNGKIRLPGRYLLSLLN